MRTVSLQSDIVGRVKRLGLKPNEKTALLPLQEALSNALHAIDDKFKLEAPVKGEITIELLFSESANYRSLDGFSITDNGIGLGIKQFDAFCKPDTVHKITRGGKGVGRLVWLKTFSGVHITSVYEDEGNSLSRRFNFVLDDHSQIRNMILEHVHQPSEPLSIYEALIRCMPIDARFRGMASRSTLLATLCLYSRPARLRK